MSRASRRGAPPPPEPLPADAVDSHCHLDALSGPMDSADHSGDEDQGCVVQHALLAARDARVTRVVTVGDTVASSQWCAQVAEENDGVIAAVAVHPNEVGELDDAAYAELERLAGLPQVRAVGETGLDYYWGRVPPAQQQEAFRRHIELAKRHGKALVIHDRDAHDDVLRVLAEEGAPERTVLHCFSGDEEMARACVRRGYVLSFAGTVTFTNAPVLRAAAVVVPDDLLLVETDAPFLTPHPFRGHQNFPAMVAYTLRCLADLRNTDLSSLCDRVSHTADRVFGAW